jgi:N,N'-diacetyllegionaminate synthase
MVNKTLIIAEAGVNHNGDIQLAKELIDSASEAGADIVKFQTFKADALTTATASVARYQARNSPQSKTQRDLLSQLELSTEQHHILIEHCEKKGIEFFSTAFDCSSLSFLRSLGFKRYKIPSGEITNLPLIKSIGSFGVQVLLSTGMSTLGDIEQAMDVLLSSGTRRENITVLHCSTEYPTVMEDVNLLAMCSIAKAFQVAVGYSDHTVGFEIPIAAVALGASVIEKHFTLDKTLPGPDHKASLDPQELKQMVQSIRRIEIALGDGIKRPTASEKDNRAIARKSIVAAEPIKHGAVYTDNNLTTKRPGTGISPMLLETLIGRKANKNYDTDELIEL